MASDWVGRSYRPGIKVRIREVKDDGLRWGDDRPGRRGHDLGLDPGILLADRQHQLARAGLLLRASSLGIHIAIPGAISAGRPGDSEGRVDVPGLSGHLRWSLPRGLVGEGDPAEDEIRGFRPPPGCAPWWNRRCVAGADR